MNIDMLSRMFDLQHDLQTNVLGHNFERMTTEDRVAYIKDMVLGAQTELAEVLNETNWKPWAVNRGQAVRDPVLYLGEIVDVLQFLMNLTFALGGDPTEIAREIFTRHSLKVSVNRERHESRSYDGRGAKCGNCGRALDDPAVACSRRGDQGYCARDGVDVNYISARLPEVEVRAEAPAFPTATAYVGHGYENPIY